MFHFIISFNADWFYAQNVYLVINQSVYNFLLKFIYLENVCFTVIAPKNLSSV